VSVGGADNNQVTVSLADTDTAAVADLLYTLWNVDTKTVLARARLRIEPASQRV
jgi:hypothetical protein